MAIFYPDILHQFTPPRKCTYDERDVILYALGIGLGADPLNERELPFVYEKGLKTLLTAATVLSKGAADSLRSPEVPAGMRLSIPDLAKSLHGEQTVELHRPLPSSGSFSVTSRTGSSFHLPSR